ncbi:hypothetical protein ABID16_000042 [Rhizobium aquaticum]|uniref:DUF1833 domain-containing protein n=1 Tax=Rhizobium aquaticum TaxID=1549636 RepID=A0ABV2ITD5_9HYPH
MSRNLSPRFLTAAFAQETDEVVICLLTITHPDLSAPIYLSSNPTERISDDPLIYATNSRGNQYLFLPFDFTMPDDQADSAPRVQLVIDNTEQQLVAMLRSISTPATIRVEIVLASAPDQVEIALPGLQLGNAKIGEKSVSIDLVADPLVNEPFPGGSFTAGAFPGLF